MTRSGSESSTAKEPSSLDPGALAALTPELSIEGRNLSKADVFRYRVGGIGIALKDYGHRPFLARNTVGRLLLRRECRAYERAGAIPGLPAFLGRVGRFALATVWIDAVPLAEIPAGAASAAIFDRLDSVIAGLHSRGVALADLHHRDVLVGTDGAVHVVDLAAAYIVEERATAFRRRIFSRMCAQDRLAAARMRARFTGRPEGEALAASDPAAVRLWGVGRKVKAFWDRMRGKSA